MSTPPATLATLATLSDDVLGKILTMVEREKHPRSYSTTQVVLELSLVCKKFLKLLENDDRWLQDMHEEVVVWPHPQADPTTVAGYSALQTHLQKNLARENQSLRKLAAAMKRVVRDGLPAGSCDEDDWHAAIAATSSFDMVEALYEEDDFDTFYNALTYEHWGNIAVMRDCCENDEECLLSDPKMFFRLIWNSPPFIAIRARKRRLVEQSEPRDRECHEFRRDFFIESYTREKRFPFGRH